MHGQSYIAYYRVSTAKQGSSGLGIEAQKNAVEQFVSTRSARILQQFVEVESGRKTDRIELQNALSMCRLTNSVLIIAKLDRLARNVAFISKLMESGAEFLAVDFPTANRLTIHILAAVAEYERQAISDRTKAALAAAKARGVRLGSPQNLSNQKLGSMLGNKVKSAKAAARRNELIPIINEIKNGGNFTLQSIADNLNQRGIPTSWGYHWRSTQVLRLLNYVNKTG